MHDDSAIQRDDSTVMLAIETSQQAGSVAVRKANAIWMERLQARSRHDDDLLPAIDRLLKRASIQSTEWTHVAVSIGPGSFTGLRIAVATVKMFAETLGIKIIAVPSALSASYNYQGQGPIGVVLAVKNEQFWFTRLMRRDDNLWMIDGRPCLADARDADLSGLQAVLADRFLPVSLADRCRVERIDVADLRLTADACLSAAWDFDPSEKPVDALTLSPLYARAPEAVSIWEKKRRSSVP